MCYSAPVSLGTYLLGSVFSYLLYLEKDPLSKVIGGFMGYVVLMQLIEFLLWSRQVCDIINKSISFAGLILNYTQPVILAILLLKFYNQKHLNKKLIIGIMITYIILISLYIIQFMNQDKCSLKKGNPYLLWNWSDLKFAIFANILYIVTLFSLFFIGIPNKMIASIIFIIGGSTLLLSYMYYPRNFVGSIWCFFAAFIPGLFYLYKKIMNV
jgi:hypothetical protein